MHDYSFGHSFAKTETNLLLCHSNPLHAATLLFTFTPLGLCHESTCRQQARKVSCSRGDTAWDVRGAIQVGRKPFQVYFTCH